MAFGLFPQLKILILSMYADAEMDCARELFDEMHEKDVISWRVKFGGYLQ